MRKWALQVVTPLLAGVLLLLGVVALGQWSWQRLRGRERYTLPFADIECVPPAHLSRADFLEEVRYLAGAPPGLSLLDDRLAARLSRQFAGHPWVEKVERVEITPPRRVSVQLRYRTPALAVPQGDQTRVVDTHGILLPAATAAAGLPILRGIVSPPAGPAGTPWNSPAVRAAVRTVVFLRPHDGCLHLQAVEATPDGLVLTTAGGSRVRWGHAPGAEPADEAPAAAKLERLLGYCRRHGDLDHPYGACDHDVRAPEPR